MIYFVGFCVERRVLIRYKIKAWSYVKMRDSRKMFTVSLSFVSH